MWLLLYVDDTVLTGNNPSLLQYFVTALGHAFELKDLGPLNYFLGLQVHTCAHNMHLSQVKYASDLLKKANMLECKSCSTAVAAKLSLSAHASVHLSSPTEYRMLVGRLQYLTLTCPDISFAVNTVVQYMSNPLSTHMLAVKRILRYVKGTIDQGLRLRPQPTSSRISAYSDTDWAGCLDTRHSTTSYLI